VKEQHHFFPESSFHLDSETWQSNTNDATSCKWYFCKQASWRHSIRQTIITEPKWQQRPVINRCPQIPTSKICLLESNLRGAAGVSEWGSVVWKCSYWKNGKESIFFPHPRNWNNTIPEQLLEESFHSCP
jgi:hypothetical protein